jgi:uncharacterized protein YkwD
MPTTSTRPLLHAVATLITFAALCAPASAATGGASCPGATTIPASGGSDLSDAAGAIFCLVNAERSSRGLASLTRDPDLTQAARGHSKDMVRNDYFAHTAPHGETFKDRLREAGYGGGGVGWRAGENLGWGTGLRATPSALVDAWLESPGHRRVLLRDAYREFGVGVVGGAPNQDGWLPGATYTMNLGVTGTR